jgi:hypothetical protein
MPVKEPVDGAYELIDMPGAEDLQILATTKSTSSHWHNRSGSKAPWWMVSIKTSKELLSSSVEGNSAYKNFAELYGFHVLAWREVSTDVSNQLFTSAMIRHEDCVILIPNGGYVAELENAMNSGTHITKIVIQGIGWFNNALKPFTTISFDNSFILAVVQDLDRAFIKFRVHCKSHTFFVYDQKGTSSGQSICSIKLDENTSDLA